MFDISATMAEGCTMTSKICLIVLGLIFWAAAAGLFFIGGWVFSTYHHFDELTRANLTLIPAGFLICVGVIMFILGIVGCIAAFKENKCLLAVMRKAVEDGVEDAVNKYNGTQKDQIDYLQGEGCVSDLVDKFLVNLVYITSIAIAFAVIQILGMISSCVLFCRSQEVRYEVLGGPNSGLRV
ncbi:hypothetical protein KUTeg_018066 [Tegillarca granosa]|uniref:Tetraspanin n=1 Tax=Tegillarca granosa TaxID=220873 RepID=A0ABQ9EMJ1_TEGGR|nr:hypothetical protein KUTeg_018066 [Tegillarca granosa]